MMHSPFNIPLHPIRLSQRKPVVAFQGSTGAMRSPTGRKIPVTCGNNQHFLQRAEYF
jgi:hypothetical protein